MMRGMPFSPNDVGRNLSPVTPDAPEVFDGALQNAAPAPQPSGRPAAQPFGTIVGQNFSKKYKDKKLEGIVLEAAPPLNVKRIDTAEEPLGLAVYDAPHPLWHMSGDASWHMSGHHDPHPGLKEGVSYITDGTFEDGFLAKIPVRFSCLINAGEHRWSISKSYDFDLSKPPVARYLVSKTYRSKRHAGDFKRTGELREAGHYDIKINPAFFDLQEN
jgi:hypothetical protein